MSRSEERKEAEAFVALIFDDWDEDERAMMVDLMCDEPDESELESDFPSTPNVARLSTVSSKELAQQISAEMTAVLARVRAASEGEGGNR